MDLARTMVEAVDGLRSGRVIISCMPSQAVSPLAPLVGRFLQRYPGVHVSVRAAATTDDVVFALRLGDAELGLIARPTLMPAPAGFTLHPLQMQRYICVAVGSSSLPAGAGPIEPEALSVLGCAEQPR